MSSTQEYLIIKNRAEQQRGVIKRMQAFVELEQQKLKEILSECTHLQLIEEKSYDSGSYYDKASTTYWHRCSLCGATSKSRVEQHSYYG